jgi:hypothetical protein
MKEFVCKICKNEKTVEGLICLKCQRRNKRENNIKQLPEMMMACGIPKLFLNARISDFPKLIKPLDLEMSIIPHANGLYKGRWGGKDKEIPDYVFPNPPKGFLVTGPVGMGKTHFLAAIAAEVLLDGGKVMFIQAANFLRDVRTSYGKDKEEIAKQLEKYTNLKIPVVEDLVKKAQTIDYLFIDDFGIDKETEWAFETWFVILNSRYGDCKYTSISMNDPKVLEPRLKRRIVETTNPVRFSK